jgi:hypothetical protein
LKSEIKLSNTHFAGFEGWQDQDGWTFTPLHHFTATKVLHMYSKDNMGRLPQGQ